MLIETQEKGTVVFVDGEKGYALVRSEEGDPIHLALNEQRWVEKRQSGPGHFFAEQVRSEIQEGDEVVFIRESRDHHPDHGRLWGQQPPAPIKKTDPVLQQTPLEIHPNPQGPELADEVVVNEAVQPMPSNPDKAKRRERIERRKKEAELV